MEVYPESSHHPTTPSKTGWLVSCFGFNGPFETVFQSISGRLLKRGRNRRERIDTSKNDQTTPTCTFCKRSRSLPYCNPKCRTPRHCKFTQHHRTTRPPPVRRGWSGGAMVLGKLPVPTGSLPRTIAPPDRPPCKTGVVGESDGPG